MARIPSTEIAWQEDEPEPVLDAIAALTFADAGWLNLSPEVEGDYQNPPRSMFAWLFSARGEPIPLITWSPLRDGYGRVEIGIQHGTGGQVLRRLASLGHPRPEGWLRRADHARRGLVVETTPSPDTEAALDWAIRAAHLLSPAPLSGRWLATVYRPGT